MSISTEEIRILLKFLNKYNMERKEMKAEELKKKYMEKEIALTIVKRAGKETAYLIGRSGEPMMDLALMAEAFQKVLNENAKYFRSKREARIELIELMEEMCDEAFREDRHEKIS